jgi:hypothetical protein
MLFSDVPYYVEPPKPRKKNLSKWWRSDAKIRVVPVVFVRQVSAWGAPTECLNEGGAASV